jgi:hypothetical protein
MTLSLFPGDLECAILVADAAARARLSRERSPSLVQDEAMNRALRLAVIAVAVAGCTQPREPVPLTPPTASGGAAVVRRPLPESAPSGPTTASVAPARAAREAPVVVPPGVIYVCVSEAGGVRTQTAIEFAPKVGALCVKHPEVGPCQYERDVCRRSGGRVYAAGGIEITAQTEAEYDKKVMRVRFKATN